MAHRRTSGRPACPRSRPPTHGTLIPLMRAQTGIVCRMEENINLATAANSGHFSTLVRRLCSRYSINPRRGSRPMIGRSRIGLEAAKNSTALATSLGWVVNSLRPCSLPHDMLDPSSSLYGRALACSDLACRPRVAQSLGRPRWRAHVWWPFLGERPGTTATARLGGDIGRPFNTEASFDSTRAHRDDFCPIWASYHALQAGLGHQETHRRDGSQQPLPFCNGKSHRLDDCIPALLTSTSIRP